MNSARSSTCPTSWIRVTSRSSSLNSNLSRLHFQRLKKRTLCFKKGSGKPPKCNLFRFAAQTAYVFKALVAIASQPQDRKSARKKKGKREMITVSHDFQRLKKRTLCFKKGSGKPPKCTSRSKFDLLIDCGRLSSFAGIF